LLSLIVFLFFLAANNAWLNLNGMLAAEGAMGLFGTGQGMVLGFQVVDMNVFLGMLLGCLTAYIHNKFSDIAFIDLLSIYGGPRFSFILMIPITLVLAISLCYVWPIVNAWITSLSDVILTAGLFGVFIYAFGNRFLIPTGLHHLLWMPFCFTALGGTAEIGGKMYSGAVNIFYAEMANAGTIASLDPSLRFATFGFVKIFGSVAVGLALIHCAKKERKDEIKGMILPSVFVGAVAGVTEPLDFSFLFASPLLWLVHSLLTAISEVILWAIGARTYMLYGLIDTVVSNSVIPPSLSKFYLVIIVGLIMSVIWYFTFVFLINKFNLKTPGREDIAVTSEGIELTIASSEQQQLGETNATSEVTKADVAIVIEGLGGSENIEVVTNCFTRLRVTVKESTQVDEEILKQCSKQKGVVMNGNNIQVIIGMGVPEFKEAVCEELGIIE
ncbi:hypothetical protein I586_01203, partial [Enterococcus moraviensis ATCC BAA-383]